MCKEDKTTTMATDLHPGGPPLWQGHIWAGGCTTGLGEPGSTRRGTEDSRVHVEGSSGVLWHQGNGRPHIFGVDGD